MEPISGVSGLPSALKIQGRGVGGHQWAGLGQGEKSSGGDRRNSPQMSPSLFPAGFPAKAVQDPGSLGGQWLLGSE